MLLALSRTTNLASICRVGAQIALSPNAHRVHFVSLSVDKRPPKLILLVLRPFLSCLLHKIEN